MDRKGFWYIVAESAELKKKDVLSRKVLNEWLAVFRDENGRAVALQDRCLHRSAQISKGAVTQGGLRCPYHGWKYNSAGIVVDIPSEGPQSGQIRSRCAVRYATLEQDDYIYVGLLDEMKTKPFVMPSYKSKGYTTIRLQNLFNNTVTNCAENFVDIPHTTFVHPRIFRDPTGQRMSASVERRNGSVKVTYHGEKSHLGIFNWFLNSGGNEIKHTDEFFVPNITSVNYWFSGEKHFIITSQSVPITDSETLVYTDLTYNYGIWNWVSRPIVRRQAQIIIDQDVKILANQMATISRYGGNFQNTSADVIHTFIESIQNEIEFDRDPYALPERNTNIEFWI